MEYNILGGYSLFGYFVPHLSPKYDTWLWGHMTVIWIDDHEFQPLLWYILKLYLIRSLSYRKLYDHDIEILIKKYIIILLNYFIKKIIFCGDQSYNGTNSSWGKI